MHIALLTLLAALQQQGAAPKPATPQTPASPVARVVITPATRSVTSGDTIRFSAQALDASGKPVPNARIIFAGRGAGAVDSTGLVTAGETGKLGVTVVALVPGTKPVLERFDIVLTPGPAARVTIDPKPTKLIAGQRLKLSARSFSAKGDERNDEIVWKISSPGVVRIGADGLIRAVAAGRATITATAGSATGSLPVTVVANTIAAIEVTPARATARQGDVVRFKAVIKDRTGKEITGVTPSWTFSPGQGVIEVEGAFVGYEPGEYVITASFGDRSADALVRLEHRDVRRPATIVGRLPRTLFPTAEVWLHPNGKIAYLGTHGGGDRLYAIDITNPAKPTVTDSIVANTRLVNDIMTTADGKYLVFTREGAADRKNGIVIASTEDAAHPKVISEFTEGVTAGVHSAFVYTQPKHGTHVYLTNDGTGAFHIIDISDPYKPREAAQWRTDRPDAGRYLHDVDVQDGLAYLSYWNDGLVILDVGNGIKGGSPSNPRLVSQFKYDLAELYRDVEAVSGEGFTRGTHTAWRHKNYVFIADEVYRAKPVEGAKDASANRMYGRLQVIDVSDMTNPRSVAWYEPEYGGVHNVWVAGDTLYMGAYDAEFRAFDISGELLGDLRAQAREIAHVNTADMDGNVKNAAFAWGVVVRDGLAYINDFNNGLWIVRIEPRAALTP
ncbi:MAG: Ig-like domain-containing protein [Gemmatimonadaceae bacterium]